jgi:AcrR family transcriptional regulator
MTQIVDAETADRPASTSFPTKENSPHTPIIATEPSEPTEARRTNTGAEISDRPLRRDAELNRQRILASARVVFSERGLEATLDDIAHHAGLGVGTVYRRFPSKEHLIEAMFVERLREIGAVVQRSFSEPDAWQGFVRCTYELAELHASDRGLREILLSNAYGHNKVALAKAELGPLFTKVFERAQKSGQLRADVEPTDIPLIQLMIGGVAEYSVDVAPELWRRCLDLLLDGLRASDEPRAALTEPPLEQEQLEQVMSSWRCPRH